MTAFFQDAASILEAAESAKEGVNWTILTGGPGGIRMIADSDWALDRLREETGAGAAYRVHHRKPGQVEVEGRSSTQTCALRAMPMAQVARLMLRAY